MKPDMSEAHQQVINMLLWHLDRPRVFEWGCGGSTVEFAPLAGEWVCVEPNPVWALEVSARVKHLPVSIKIIDYGIDVALSPGEFQDELKKLDMFEYIDACRRYPPFDVYLVDGRKRMQCIDEVINEQDCERSWIILHDAERYQRKFDVESYMEYVDGDSKLLVMRCH